MFRERRTMRNLGRFAIPALPYAILTGTVLLVSWGSLARRDIDGLDEAHHIMDGIFFADLMADRPFDRLARYPFDYYRQYPALGFTFWPPFYAFIEGLFFRACGLDLIVPRVCMLFFGVVLAFGMYAYCRPTAGAPYSLFGACLVLTTPLLAESANRVMLEIPALAMSFVTVILYRRLAERGRWKGWGEVCLLSMAGAAVVYTKQTMIFLFPAILIDVIVNRRELLRQPRTGASAGLLILLCVPLLLFTLKYGGVNLAQSFGGRGNIYVPEHGGSSRWTLAGWLYYALQLPGLVNPILCGLAVGTLAYGAARPAFLRGQALLLGWILTWYVLFSLLDNKQPRFATFVVPAVILLAIEFVAAATRRRPAAGAVGCSLLAVILAAQAVTVARAPRRGYSGMERILAKLVRESPPNNIAYIGNHRQMFVPWVRVLDPSRGISVLQGDDIARASGDFAAACRDFRVRWVLLEDPSEGDEESGRILRRLEGAPFERVGREAFGPERAAVAVETYRYRGPFAETSKEIPLRSEVQGIAD